MKRCAFILTLAVLLPGCAPEQLPVRLLGQADCQNEPCAIHAEIMSIVFKRPNEIKPLVPFEAALELDTTLLVDSVTVDFVMPGMEMGQNQYLFVPNEQQNTWMGKKLMLPVCVTGRSDWRADVEVFADGIIYEARFDFVVNN